MTSTPIWSEEHMYSSSDRMPCKVSLVSNMADSPFMCPVPGQQYQQDLFQEGFGTSLQVAATEFKKLRKPQVSKLKSCYSSDASLVYQSWLKDIMMYVPECQLSQLEAIQLVNDYTDEHVWLEVRHYLSLTLEGTQSFKRLLVHLSLAFHSCARVTSLINNFVKGPKAERIRWCLHWWVTDIDA